MGGAVYIMDIIIIILETALIVLSLTAVIQLARLGGQKGQKESAEELRRLRGELGASLEGMNEKLNQMTKENFQLRHDLSESVNEKLGSLRTQNAELSERLTAVLRESLDKLREGNEKKLDEMRATVDEKLSSTLTTRLDSSFKTVSEQLENVYKSLGEMKELSTGVSSLNKMLTNVKVRGNWAEYQLEDILDQTIPGMYIKNYSPDNNAERVEFAVRIPSGAEGGESIYLPIDSKFPLEDYTRLCDAADSGDTGAVAAARKALEARVISEAKDISSKYIRVPQTTPFAILYLATEGLYAEIASSRNGVMEELHRKYNVMTAGPTTVTALLNSLSVGFKTVAINEKANEIRKILGAVKTQYDAFNELLDRVGKQIGTAGKSIETAQTRTRSIRRTLKGVEALEQGEADSLLGITQTDIPVEDI